MNQIFPPTRQCLSKGSVSPGAASKEGRCTLGSQRDASRAHAHLQAESDRWREAGVVNLWGEDVQDFDPVPTEPQQTRPWVRRISAAAGIVLGCFAAAYALSKVVELLRSGK